jgi:hypothetical protein
VSFHDGDPICIKDFKQGLLVSIIPREVNSSKYDENAHRQLGGSPSKSLMERGQLNPIFKMRLLRSRGMYHLFHKYRTASPGKGAFKVRRLPPAVGSTRIVVPSLGRIHSIFSVPEAVERSTVTSPP